jgi:hypothetical protein
MLIQKDLCRWWRGDNLSLLSAVRDTRERLLGGCDTVGPAISFDRDGGENHAFSLWLDGWMAGWAPSSFLWRNRQGEFQPVCNQLKALIMDEPYRSLSPLLLMYIWGVSSCCYSKGLLNQSGRRSQRKRMSSHERASNHETGE